MSGGSDSIRTPLARARGLGSARDGVGRWVALRVSAVANVFLIVWFVWFTLGAVGADYIQFSYHLGHPFNAVKGEVGRFVRRTLDKLEPSRELQLLAGLDGSTPWLKPAANYTAINAEQAAARLDDFADKWGQICPAAVKLWRNAWGEFIPFLDYDVEIRKIICTTDEIVNGEGWGWSFREGSLAA